MTTTHPIGQRFAVLVALFLLAAIAHAAAPAGGGDLSRIDVCQVIPEAEVAKALGRKLVERPKPIHLNEQKTDSGCSWSAGKNSSGDAYFAYAVIAPAADFAAAKRGFAVKPVAGLGDEALTTNGADAEQLWVLVRGKGAVMVAIGDPPNPAGAKKLVPFLLAKLGR